jgi:hypothetical protein
MGMSPETHYHPGHIRSPLELVHHTIEVALEGLWSLVIIGVRITGENGAKFVERHLKSFDISRTT